MLNSAVRFKNGCSIHWLLNSYDGRQDRSQRLYPEMPELPGASHLDLKCSSHSAVLLGYYYLANTNRIPQPTRPPHPHQSV